MMIKKLSFSILVLLFASNIFSQNINDIFLKYQENKDCRYVSISKGMINLASLFGKEDPGNENMISKVEEMKVLTLKAGRKSGESKKFFTDIENCVSAKPSFQPLMEARENGVHTRVLDRPNEKKKNSEIVIISKSDSVQHFIWFKGKISTEELQQMIKK